MSREVHVRISEGLGVKFPRSTQPYIPTAEGWLYLVGHKDLFTGEITGFAMGSRMTKNLVSQSLFHAVAAKRNRRYSTPQEAQKEITEYIEMFYNRKRRQARLGYLSPAAFQKNFVKEQCTVLTKVLVSAIDDRPQYAVIGGDESTYSRKAASHV